MPAAGLVDPGEGEMKTTKHHFEIFQRECEKWIMRFGLLGWRFYYQHKDIEERQLAYCLYPDDPQDRVFTLGLTLNLEGDYPMIDIKRTAFHEVMEAFLYKMKYLAQARYVQPEEIHEETHNLVRTLENVVWQGEK